jgi:hypothetical protein
MIVMGGGVFACAAESGVVDNGVEPDRSHPLSAALRIS